LYNKRGGDMKCIVCKEAEAYKDKKLCASCGIKALDGFICGETKAEVKDER
jgi:hypothetical protein